MRGMARIWLGAFYQPRLVIGGYRCVKRRCRIASAALGYAEIIKYGLINDPTFLIGWSNMATKSSLWTQMRSQKPLRSRAAPKRILLPKMSARAAFARLLNLGHTFGHALEAENGYRPNLLHGEAVGTGMVAGFALLGAARPDEPRGC